MITEVGCEAREGPHRCTEGCVGDGATRSECSGLRLLSAARDSVPSMSQEEQRWGGGEEEVDAGVKGEAKQFYSGAIFHNKAVVEGTVRRKATASQRK